MLAETGEVTDSIRSMLIVDYPDDVKKEIVRKYNEYSSSIVTEK
jgi:hypothetical protein